MEKQGILDIIFSEYIVKMKMKIKKIFKKFRNIFHHDLVDHIAVDSSYRFSTGSMKKIQVHVN